MRQAKTWRFYFQGANSETLSESMDTDGCALGPLHWITSGETASEKRPPMMAAVQMSPGTKEGLK